MAAIVPENIDGHYLLFYLKSIYKAIREFARGGNQEGLNCHIISELKVLVPPFYEQIKISKFIFLQIGHTTHAIHLQTQQIAKLREYRTVLIDAAVTGKMRVPGW